MSATTTRPEPRAQKLALQGAANRVVRGLLRTPLLSRLVGRRLILIYVVGRTSGRRYTVPVAYSAQGDALLVGTPFAWGRNLRTGEPVQILLKGRRHWADVQVFSDEQGVIAGYAAMARDNHQFAKFNHIRLDDAGEPDANDLQLAWAAGARAFRLTPRVP